ncbi:MAG TPA: CerR family C-terminal domain-containing protein [Thermodesulfobacteriota bacterium]|nr:CerR family C-terminal domain-containing protein [Thermodesulfobacteriota bacterium]
MEDKVKSTVGSRERILEAAGEVFAECGFRSATVRRICEHAGVNIAAINYYFGGKEKLYSEVLRHWSEYALKKYPLLLGLGEEASVEEQLEAFVRSLMFRLLDKGKPAWFGKLMAKEMTEPTQAFERLIKEIVRPRDKILASIVQKMIGTPVSEEQIRLCCASILGQCIYYYNARAIMAKVYRRDVSKAEEIERIAHHIVQFSLKALEHFSEGDKDRAKKDITRTEENQYEQGEKV